ncbi:hypothetical protein NIES593_18835 [Hydrococcus rivularis NIES-593]|uniref:Uncharacterized protein n=1 Tax=Hydrococcus rivularis NIES-593 TaxID=1921803 RepID=A0A1U7HA46_9CYAN|nr:hypothetical protein NIES593_18835 [Hydrococcus rivularis NIES-593]
MPLLPKLKSFLNYIEVVEANEVKQNSILLATSIFTLLSTGMGMSTAFGTAWDFTDIQKVTKSYALPNHKYSASIVGAVSSVIV